MATRLLGSMPSSSTLGSSASAMARPHADSAPPALRSFRSDTDVANQRMVVRIYFSDGAFKSIMINGLTTANEACLMFAEKVRMERFQKSFQLKEVTPSVQRMVDPNERPFEIVHRWINEGFKLSMDEKWRFVFTFTQEAQNRLLRKTKRLLFSQLQSELKQQLKSQPASRAPPPPPKRLAPSSSATTRHDEPPDCGRAAALPASPRMHASTSSSSSSSPSPSSSSSSYSLLESSTSTPVRRDELEADQAASSSSTPFFVSTSPRPQTSTPPQPQAGGATGTLRGGFSSLPPLSTSPRMAPQVPSPQSVPPQPAPVVSSVRGRRQARPSPLMLASFNIDSEAQLAAAETQFNRESTSKLASAYTPASLAVDPPAASVEFGLGDLPPPPASMLPPPPVPMMMKMPMMEAEPGTDRDSYLSSSSYESEEEREGEDELVAMLVQSTLQDSQVRGMPLRDCSEQMMNNLDDALAMLAKLEFDLG